MSENGKHIFLRTAPIFMALLLEILPNLINRSCHKKELKQTFPLFVHCKGHCVIQETAAKTDSTEGNFLLCLNLLLIMNFIQLVTIIQLFSKFSRVTL